MDYEKLQFKAGIEIHQQIAGKKLFCSCPTLVHDDNSPTIEFQRKLRASAGETGKVDQAAQFEMDKEKIFVYKAAPTSSCLVEYDDEPPHALNNHALLLALEVSKLMHCTIVNELHFMRKTVVDGSNVSGFQRTGLVSTDGYIDTSKGQVRIGAICLEEEAAQKLDAKKHIVTFSLDRLGVGLLEIATEPDIKDPDHAKEVAAIIGMMLRSTEKVRRGIGSIRQDVNVSIKGHPRVEIKGFQEIKSMPMVIKKEIIRQQKDKKGKSHVRKVAVDGSTSFLRPMPGAARMYPETDVPIVKISQLMINKVKIPELIDEKVIRYEKEFNINSELARELVKSNIDFKNFTKYKNLDCKFIGEVLINVPKDIKKRFKLDVSKLKYSDYHEVLGYVDNSLISKEAVLDILCLKLNGKKVELKDFAPVDMDYVEKIIKKVVKENKGASIGALMGILMKDLRGKVDGNIVMAILKKIV
jgi:Glu-tRNA(Gln) amidotransferase subunit E-like FAD-binding protein